MDATRTTRQLEETIDEFEKQKIRDVKVSKRHTANTQISISDVFLHIMEILNAPSISFFSFLLIIHFYKLLECSAPLLE